MLRRLSVLVVASLLTAACGSRLPDDVLADIDEQARGNGSADNRSNADSNDDVNGNGDIAVGGDGATATTGDSNGVGPGAVGPVAPGVSPAATANCVGTSTATGVTATEIKVAAMVTASGPLPGATEGDYRGAAAYLAKINSEGGVCGRKITILKGDDGLDPQRARSEFLRLEPQVFAFVGSLAVADSGVIDLIEKTKVPWVGASVDPAGRKLNNVLPHSIANTSHTGPFVYFRQEYPSVTKVGFMYADVGGVRANAPTAREAIKKVGYDIVYDSGAGTTSPDYTAEVINMRSLGVQMLYLFAVEVNQHVRIARNMRQQNFEPPLKVSQIGYNSKLTELLGDVANGWKNNITYLPMLNDDEPARAPALAEFLKWNRQVFPSAQIDLFPVNGWAYAALFVKGLRAVGGSLNRTNIIDAINAIEEDDGAGMVARFSPKEARNFGCFIIVKIENRKWVREHPASGYECGVGEPFAFGPPG